MPVLSPTLRLNAQGDQVKTVQTGLMQVGLTVPATETSQSTFGLGTAAAVKQFQAQAHLPVTGIIDATTQAMLTNAAAVAGTNQFQVSGQLFMDYGLPATGLRSGCTRSDSLVRPRNWLRPNRIPMESILSSTLPRPPAGTSKFGPWTHRVTK